LFALHRDQAAPEVIDAAIRSGVKVGGTNLWILIFAIVIASVGLNVNSTATIIGAMLISPLMGPIIGAGYGAGIHDFALIRQALRNLAIFTVISLLTSTLYFLVSPLHDAQSELLARTSPNIWDVLIAFFGGAAGMVGLTRKEKSTVIPGVAIATALMPPLCTTGYGIATGQPGFFLGAFYLFSINGVFIALATLAITRVLRLPQHQFADAPARRRGRMIIAGLVTAMLVPSIYLALQLVREQVFSGRANRYLDAVAATRKDLIIASQDVDPKHRRISLALVGADVGENLKQALENRLGEFGLKDAELDLRMASPGRKPDLAGLKQQVESDIRRSTLQQLEQQERALAELKDRLQRAEQTEALTRSLGAEVRAQLPIVTEVAVAASPSTGTDGATDPVGAPLFVMLEVSRPLPTAELQRLQRWLAARLPGREVKVAVTTRPGAKQAVLPMHKTSFVDKPKD
jgi:uncharacterized hydrophobic protein (TIGR00271 family)